MADNSLKSIQGVFTPDDIKKLDKIEKDSENNKKLKSQALDQDAFMKILATQLKHQDPLSPMKDQEFIGQMAQFNSLNAMNSLVELTEASSKVDNDMATMIAAMGQGIETLISKTAPVDSEITTTEEDGSKTTIKTTADGNVTTTIEKPDGTKTVTESKTNARMLLDLTSSTLEEMKKMTAAFKEYAGS